MRLLLLPLLMPMALSAGENPPTGPFLQTFPASVIDTIYVPLGTPLPGLKSPGLPAAPSPVEAKLTGIDESLKRLGERLTAMEKLLLLHDDVLREKAGKK